MINYLFFLFANNQNPGSQYEKGVICFSPWIAPGFRRTGESHNFMDMPLLYFPNLTSHWYDGKVCKIHFCK